MIPHRIIGMAGSKAFYKSRAASKLVHEYNTRQGFKRVTSSSHSKLAVQIWQTSCIVTNFSADVLERNKEFLRNPKRILVNPSNPELNGCSRFTYFPRGGPVPADQVQSSVHRDWQPLGFVSSWGGMEVGNGMMYPVSVVDGLVHQLGGWKLQAEIKWLQCRSSTPCPAGSATVTTAGNSSLAKQYDSIIHTTPPFYKHDEAPELLLRSCYESTLALVRDTAKTQPTLVAIPLLGAGARGFPTAVAIDIASSAIHKWIREDDAEHPVVLALGVLEPELAVDVRSALKSHDAQHTI